MDEIRLDGDELRIRGVTLMTKIWSLVRLDSNGLHIQGSYRALARAVSLSNEGKLDTAPSVVPEWRTQNEPKSEPALARRLQTL